jgi:glycosyltransferase involved in cell wall biosynthesis
LKIGAILPHMLLFGGVRRYVELAAAFTARGDEFVIYTPDGEPPGWTELKGRCRGLADAEQAEHDVLMTGSPEYLDTLRGIRAKLRIFYLQIEKVDREAEIVSSGDILPMANSSGLMERVRRKYGVTALDGRGGINPDLFHPVERPESVTGGPMRIMCYGRLSRPRKGTRFAVDAAKAMYADGRDVELVLFDSMTPGAPDPRIGFDPGLPFRFHIDLPQERMAEMYASADVFVSAEHRAGWSNTCAEAAACGVPLVCTASGTSDFAVDGRTALLAGRNSRSIRHKLEKLYSDREGSEKIGREGAKKILEFTWDRVCDRMAEQFADLLEDQRGTVR